MAETDTEVVLPVDSEAAEEDAIDNDESFDLDGSSDEDVDALFDKAMEDDEEDIDAEDEELDESDAEENDSKVDEDGADGEEETPEKDEKPSENANAEETGTKPNAELEDERTKRTALETQVKKTLEALGIRVDGSAIDALEKAAAEAEGISLEDYRKKSQEETEITNAREQVKRQKFEELAANDLSALKKSFPAVLDKGHIRDCFDSFEDFAKFGRLRDAGIEAKEAYLAVNGEKVIGAQAKAAQTKAASDNRGHIRSAVPKGATDETVVMPKDTLQEWREMFPDMSDKEIRKLYRDTL